MTFNIDRAKLMELKRKSYPASFKLMVIAYAERTSQACAADEYDLHKSMISRWVKDKSRIFNAKDNTRRIGSGVPAEDQSSASDLETDVSRSSSWNYTPEEETEYESDDSQATSRHIPIEKPESTCPDDRLYRRQEGIANALKLFNYSMGTLRN
jgi:transposase-like protein